MNPQSKHKPVFSLPVSHLELLRLCSFKQNKSVSPLHATTYSTTPSYFNSHNIAFLNRAQTPCYSTQPHTSCATTTVVPMTYFSSFGHLVIFLSCTLLESRYHWLPKAPRLYPWANRYYCNPSASVFHTSENSPSLFLLNNCPCNVNRTHSTRNYHCLLIHRNGKFSSSTIMYGLSQ